MILIRISQKQFIIHQTLAEHSSQSVSQSSLPKHTSYLITQRILNLAKIFALDEFLANQTLYSDITVSQLL